MSASRRDDRVAGGASPDGLPPLREVIRALGLSAPTRASARTSSSISTSPAASRAPAARSTGATVVEVGPGPGRPHARAAAEGAARVVAVERDARCRPALAADRRALSGPARRALRRCARRATGRRLLPARRPGRDRRQPALQRRDPAARRLAESEPWPPWYDAHDADVPEGGRRAHRRGARHARPMAGCRCSPSGARKPRIVLTLPPRAFTPPPKVASAVVEFTPSNGAAPPCRRRRWRRSPPPPSASGARCCAPA